MSSARCGWCAYPLTREQRRYCSKRCLGAATVDARPLYRGHAFGSDTQPCGTPAAYRRHYRHHEPPCLPCRRANSRYVQDREAARRAS